MQANNKKITFLIGLNDFDRPLYDKKERKRYTAYAAYLMLTVCSNLSPCDRL